MRLQIYSRPGCHLCEEMAGIVRRAIAGRPATLEEIDISKDPDLERIYGEQIPVLMIDGRKVAKYRISEREIRRVLTAPDQG
jgi:glutaredoxin